MHAGYAIENCCSVKNAQRLRRIIRVTTRQLVYWIQHQSSVTLPVLKTAKEGENDDDTEEEEVANDDEWNLMDAM